MISTRARTTRAVVGALTAVLAVPFTLAIGDAGASGAGECEDTDEVTVVLKWVAQSQFAGFFAAKDLGYYDEACLDVEIMPGGGNIVPHQVLAAGTAEFAVDHQVNSLVAREEGADSVNIAQIFRRGGYLQVAWADSGITTVDDLAGTRVGSWGFGNELILYAALRDAGIEPNVDAEIVQQPFDVTMLLRREVDSIQAKTYNEYAQLLEATNPDTGELYQPEDFSVINLNELGYDNLEDAVYARGEWLAEEGNAEIAQRFLEATFRGWAFCRDSFDECVQIVLDNGSALGQGHMTWMLNEINKLIWPSTGGVGIMDEGAYDRTVEVLLAGGVLSGEPEDGAFRTDIAEAAVAALTEQGVDVVGEDYEPLDVEVTPGGE